MALLGVKDDMKETWLRDSGTNDVDLEFSLREETKRVL